MKTIELIKSDLFRYYGFLSLTIFIKAFFFNRGFIYMFWFRWSQSNIKRISSFSKIILLLKNRKFGIDIPYSTKIGYGFYIGHGGPVIISPTAIIGNNCNISQYTTIGSNKDKAAVIGDNVYLGPSVCIVENIIIEDNVTIGAGSVVTKNIPSNATVAGNYAKILNYNEPGKFIKNRWELLQ